MDSNKETGSYYTPYELIEFMVRYLKEKKQDLSNVLEPSAGDGRFLSALLSDCRKIKAIELFDEKVSDIKEKYNEKKLVVEQYDFLDYAMESEEKYSLIIGNPPYINPKIMKKEEIKKAKELCKSEEVDASAMQNMWLAFVVGASKLLEKDGAIFFVLPMEFLQVQYAEKLRAHLESKFNTIHIITFENSIFPDIEQDICLVYIKNKEKKQAYISYEKYRDTSSKEPIFSNVIKKNKPLKKWSNAILSDYEILLLKEKSEKYSKIESMGVSAPGIVTGGNKYFILTEDKVKEYKCEEFVLPILQKSSYITKNTIVIDDELMNDIRNDKPMYVLNLSKEKEENIPPKLLNYLDWAKDQEIGGVKLKDRFKCKNRTPWYGVPIVNKGDVVFFKRYHLIPRVYINRASIHTTDAGYHIRLREEINKDSFVFCFYNSLTLAQCEFEGRYYGGGVSELVPGEFKQLNIPYREIKKTDIEMLNEMFKSKKSIEEIVSFVNERTIGEDMEDYIVKNIEKVRVKLVERRIKN